VDEALNLLEKEGKGRLEGLKKKFNI